MGIVEGLKGIYFKAEENYYGLLDAINEKIPIYKVIDPIDRIVPSFALILIIIGLLAILLLLFGASFLLQAVLPSTTTLRVEVLDDLGEIVPAARVTFRMDGKTVDSQLSDEKGIAELAGLEKGQLVELTAEKDGYITNDAEFLITEFPLQTAEIKITLESRGFSTKTIRITDNFGSALAGNFTLSFSCSNPYATPPGDITLVPADNGEAKVDFANNCEKLRVSVRSSHYEDYGPAEALGELFIIRLEKAEVEDAHIIVLLSTAEEKPVDGITVELYSYNDLAANPEVGPIDAEYSIGGRAEFYKQPGRYVLKTYDAGALYGEKQSGVIDVGSGETHTESLVLAESIKGQIKIQVKNKSSKAIIDNARVRLYFESNNSELTSLKTDSEDNNGVVSFNISRDASYRAIVEADGYALGRMDNLRIGSSIIIVELYKCTPATCGMLLVRVVDQDGLPVENATVAIYNARTNFLEGHANRNSDVNGIARFRGISSGNYKAFAFKESNSGWSDETYFSSTASDDNSVDLTVVMQIANGIVRANVKDSDGKPVPFPVISIYNAQNNKLIGSDYGDLNGFYEIETKADKKVYLVVKKKDSSPRMADYTTAAKAVLPSTVQAFDVIMEPEMIDRKPEIKFLGLYQKEKLALTLGIGEEYTARLQLKIPETHSYELAGMHLRTGKETIVEKDQLFIKSINAPYTSVIKAAYYDENSNLGEADYTVTADNAKWANIVWHSPAAGIYEVEARIRVKETASIGDELLINYRAWAENSETVRDPETRYLRGEGLYAETYTERYQVGVTTLCDSEFCFSSTITDLEEGLTEAVTNSYQAKTYNNYLWRFTLQNNSSTRIHDNADLRIENRDESILFGNYLIYDAQARPLEGSINGYSFPRINVGKLEPRNKVNAQEIYFIAQKAAAANINIKLVSDQRIAFEKNLTISIAAPKELEAIVAPTAFPSGIETDINILVKDRATRLELEGAAAKLRDRFGNVITHSRTGKDGYAYLTVPAQAPGKELKLYIEMPNYNTKIIEININPAVLELSPERIGISLNTKNRSESDEKFSVRNLTSFPLKITGIKLEGNFKSLLDMERIANWLEANYRDFTVKPGERVEMHLKSYLSDDGMAIDERADLEGILLIDAENFGKRWVVTVPVTIAIGLGAEVDDPTCLVLTRADWQASTEGEPISLEFSIQNNCTVEGMPVGLTALEAKTEPKGNQLGSYSITIGENETELRSGYFRTLLGRIPAEESYSAIITFRPYGGVNGTDETKILIRASNVLEGKDQLLTAEIKAKLTAVNVKECISFDRHLVEIEEKSSTAFTITTKGCGEAVDLRLDSKLDLSAKEFTMGENDSKSIEIMAGENYPGQYPVFVKAKLAGEAQEKLIETIRARIKLPPGACISINRYEFDVYDSPSDDYDGYDIAELSNNCLEKDVSFRVDMRDVVAALKDGSKWGLIIFAAGLLGDKSISLSSLLGLEKTKAAEKPIETACEGAGGRCIAEDDKEYYCPKYMEKSEFTVGCNDALESNAVCCSEAKEYEKNATNGKPCRIVGILLKRDNCMKGLECVDGKCTKNNGHLQGNNDRVSAALPIDIPSATAYAVMANFLVMPSDAQLEAAGLGPTGLALMDGGGLLMGTMNSMIEGILGKGNPISKGLKAWVLATFATYWGQEREASFRVTRPDLEIKNLELLKAVGKEDVQDKDVGLTQPAEAYTERDPKTGKKAEKRGLVFANETGFTNSEEEPSYKWLKVEGIGRIYNTEKVYSKDDFAVLNKKGWFEFGGGEERIDPESRPLEEKTPEKVKQYFHLEFRSVPPEGPAQEIRGLLNCQAGTRQGSTGEAAFQGEKAPLRIKLDWDWGSISENECDAGNPDFIYCDATQFSIEVLKKIERINTFLKSAGSRLSCPSPLDIYSNTAEIGSYDIGVSSIAIDKQEKSVKVTANIKNTNPGKIKTRAEIYATKIDGTGRVDCTGGAKELSVLSEESIECTFTLADADYTATAKIVPEIDCVNCRNTTASDTLAINFTMGKTGLEQCEPYTTKRLGGAGGFLHASNITGTEEIEAAITFQAHLIRDRYSPDFQADFDSYSKLKSFFRAPQWYTRDLESMGRYFQDFELFRFVPKYGEENPEGYLLPGPGIYNVTINITYNDSSWQLFKNGQPNAKIRIELDKADVPQPDSPFYYLPFDGPIGFDGRVGYGINYRGDVVTLSEQPEVVRSIEMAGSTPVPQGMLTVTHSSSFKRINNEHRGEVLSLTRGENPTMIYSPSYATPVMMMISNRKEDAFGFYEVESMGGAQDVGASMSSWYGIGINCRSFSDRPVVEEFWETSDMHGLRQYRNCSVLPEEKAATSYGFEFCNPVKFGNLYLKTIFYTPYTTQGSYEKQNYMKAVAGNDSITLIGNVPTQDMIELNGAPELPVMNNIKEMLGLIRDEYLCVSSTDSKAEFWWNPKKIFEADSFGKAEDQAIKDCITG